MLISAFRENPIVINIELTGINHRFINGKVRNRKFSKGYCNCDLHRGCMDSQQIAQHKCYEKECTHFFDIIDDYYEEKKNSHKEILKQEKQIAAEEKEIIRQCNEMTDSFEGIKIIAASKRSGGIWVLEYITVCSIDIIKFEHKVSQVLGNIKMVRKNCDFDTALQLFLAN